MNTNFYRLQTRVKRILANLLKAGKICDYIVSENHVGVKFVKERSFIFYNLESFLEALKNGMFEIQRESSMRGAFVK